MNMAIVSSFVLEMIALGVAVTARHNIRRENVRIVVIQIVAA